MRNLSLVTLSAFLCAASGVAQTRYLTASLDGAQETPAVVTAARGWGLVTARDATMTVDVFLQATGLTGTVAHVHLGAPGAGGPVSFALGGGPTRYTAINVALSAANYAALTSGGMYLNVHTAANPGGEIRGQIVVPNTRMYTAMLDGAQETPPVVTGATGTGVAILHEPDNVLLYTVSSTGLVGVGAAHIHQAAAGVGGPVIHSLRGSAGQYCGVTGKLTAAQLTALNASGLYFNIHTGANPGGEIRGQILPAGGNAALTGAMDGAQETPPVVTAAFGHACFRLNPNNTMGYVVTTSGVAGTVAHVHKGAVGVGGGVVFALTGGPTVWSGTTPILTPAQLADAAAGLWYANVHSAAHAGGEIRGQLRPAVLPTTFGAACPGSAGTLAEIGSNGVACLGAPFAVTVTNATAARGGAFLLGFNVFNPPIDLSVLMMGGCFLTHDVSPLSLPFATDASGCGSSPLPVPFSPPLLNASFYNTAAVLDLGANPLGIALSNSLSSRIQ